MPGVNMIEIQRDDGEVVTIRSLETIGRLLDRGSINETTLVRNQGESDFIPARNHSEIAEVASMVGRPFPSPKRATPTASKTAQTPPVDVSAEDNGTDPVNVKPTPASRRKPTVPPVLPSTPSHKSPWAVSQGARSGLGDVDAPSASQRRPTTSLGTSNVAVGQTPEPPQAPAIRATEPLIPHHVRQMASQPGISQASKSPPPKGSRRDLKLLLSATAIVVVIITAKFWEFFPPDSNSFHRSRISNSTPATPAPPMAAPEPNSTIQNSHRTGGASSRPAAPSPPPITAPEAGLLEEGRFGPLPRVGDAGRTSIRAYSGAFDRRDTRPRVGIVIADIGISSSQTEDAIRRLPAGISLAISPYAQRLALVAERARTRGMESLVAIPLEPTGYPLNDPGNRALLTGRSAPENIANLEWVLSRFPGYVGAIGVVGGMRGERFAAGEKDFLAMQEVLRNRGLLYIDARPGAPGPARAWGRSVDLILDEPATRAEIEKRLAELEAKAKAHGSALGLAHAATPLVVDSVLAWATGLEDRGVALAPVTALIRRPTTIYTSTERATATNLGEYVSTEQIFGDWRFQKRSDGNGRVSCVLLSGRASTEASLRTGIFRTRDLEVRFFYDAFVEPINPRVITIGGRRFYLSYLETVSMNNGRRIHQYTFPNEAREAFVAEATMNIDGNNISLIGSRTAYDALLSCEKN